MKKIKVTITLLLVIATLTVNAQSKLFTRNGKINFFSKTTAENIDADNNEVFSMIDPQKKSVAFQLLNTGFKFERALMQEHFNENYIESSKFPKTTFQGIITDSSKVDFNKDGKYDVSISGSLTMHGVTKKNDIKAIIIVSGKNVTGKSNFIIKLSDYNIKIPTLVANQISQAVSISVSCNYEPFTR